YPTKNLKHFYHKHRYPHQHFHKHHKPTSIITSQITKHPKPKIITSTPILLYINPNTTTPKAYFLIHNIKHHTNPTPIHNQNKYPLKINHNNIFPTNPISHHNLKKQIQN
ncbi:Csa1 family protein, partial [Staphylococcus epidermidis]|uniref:Csa1 family protein n=1 Tax=Staphylococcus epidermidis TaxID=1282 RepID=UPI0011A6D3C7